MPQTPRIPNRKTHSGNNFLSSSSIKNSAEIQDLMKKAVEKHRLGELENAESFYQLVLLKDPKNYDAYNLSSVIANQKNDLALALRLIEKAITIQPKQAYAYVNRGLVFEKLEDYATAIVSYEKAITLNPNFAEAYNNKGISLKKLERFEEAITSYKQAISINKNYAVAYSNLGNALREMTRYQEAVPYFKRAIELKPNYAEAYSNLGVTKCELACYEEALSNYEKAIELKPDYAQAHSNRGLVLQSLNRIEEALLSFDKAIYFEPDYIEAYFNKSLALLVMGDFHNGFKGYEWRWKSESIKKNAGERLFTQPLWLGNESIANKTILLWSEQGLGDSIQFCRYAKLIKSLGARVLLEVPQNLIALLDSLEGVDILIGQGASLPEFDYQCPLMSLPLAFKTEPNSIPNLSPYLKSNAEKRELWGQRLGEKSKPRIGVVWSGSARHKNDLNRSMKLTQLLDYLPSSFEYVSLQKEVREEDKTALIDSAIKHYGDQLIDFTDTAALCDLMDLVICVDTSVAHLAGALAKKTWVLLPYSPDWRWLLDRDDSPWYESITLYRQGQDREYGSVLRRVENDLTKLISKK
jgi:tetratricopeptide (TPR) repeat protein